MKLYADILPIEVYRKIQDFNWQLGEHLLNEDMEGFWQETDDFIDTGITRNPHYENMLAVYRIHTSHYYINGIPSDLIIHSLLKNDYLKDKPAFFPIDDDNTIMELAAIAKDRELPHSYRMDKTRRDKAISDFNSYIESYEFFISYDAKKLQEQYAKGIITKIDLLKEYFNEAVYPLIATRKYFDCYLDMSKIEALLDAKSRRLYQEIEAAQTFSERLEKITEYITNAYEKVYDKAGKSMTFDNFFVIDSPDKSDAMDKTKYSERQFMMGLGFGHDAINRMGAGKYHDDTFFYVALAMYLNIPTTAKVEEFIGRFGHSLNNPVRILYEKQIMGKNYIFYGKDFQKWFNAGIDYYLIYQLLHKEWGK